MRVTNGMMQNNSLSALYTNMGRMDKLFYQMNTLKKIQRPSDDPIIAGRSLKLRLNVMEAEQYANNVDEATSWMSVTEAALKNTTEIIKTIREKCNYAANGTHTPEDRQKIVDEIEQLAEQLKQEANVTYAGRYVFSGYKTDQPVFLDKDTSLGENLDLLQDLHIKGEATLTNGSILKAGTVFEKGTVFEADIKLNGKTYKAGEALVEDVKLNGDLPITTDVSFNGTAVVKGPERDPKTGEIMKDPAGNPVKGSTLAGGKDTDGKAIGSKLPKGTLNPKVFGYVEGQDIEYEIGTNNTIAVNITGMPDMVSKMMGNIEEMLTQLKDPNKTDAELNTIFTDMIGEMDDRLAETSKMESELGAKQNRLEYTQERLNDDKTNFTELLSNTENVDLEEVYVEFNTQYMVYQSALQATSKIVMNSLADFLR
ncbi:MAG: flagellar hook-associated protein FlgL [Cellulosilyticaceae bacterium]